MALVGIGALLVARTHLADPHFLSRPALWLRHPLEGLEQELATAASRTRFAWLERAGHEPQTVAEKRRP